MHSGLWLSRTLSTPRHPTLSLTGSTLVGRSPFPEPTVTCNTDRRHGRSASHRPRTAPCPQQGNGRFRRRQTAHPSRVPGTAIPGEDCDFLQMTEVPPASSVNAVLVAKVRSRSVHPAPHAAEVSRLATFQSPPASTRHTPLPTTSPDQHRRSKSLCEVAGRCRTDPGKVANRDTSPQKRQACADVSAFTSPVAWHA